MAHLGHHTPQWAEKGGVQKWRSKLSPFITKNAQIEKLQQLKASYFYRLTAFI